MWKKFKRLVVGTVILALAGLAGYLWLFGAGPGRIHVLADPPAIVREIQQLKQLVTVRFGVQKVILLKEEKVPFGSESLVLMVRAEVLGGVDLGELRPQDVQRSGASGVTIHLPAPRVMNTFVNEKSTQVWDRQKTWWTPWEPFDRDLEKKARQMGLEAAQAAALEMGLLARARENAETAIRDFLTAVGVSPVTFVAESPAPAS